MAGPDRDELRALAEAVRQACVDAALEGHEQAGLAGLCGEGRWELAVDAMRTLDLAAVVDRAALPPAPAPPSIQDKD
jgi:hypothetical protein